MMQRDDAKKLTRGETTKTISCGAPFVNNFRL